MLHIYHGVKFLPSKINFIVINKQSSLRLKLTFCSPPL